MEVIINKKEDKEHLQLINKIYELGFEVGYRNHSEIGWVLREFNKLITEAQQLGIRSPENYYNEGKTKGKASRDKGISESSEKKPYAAGTNHADETENGLSDSQEDDDAPHVLKKPPLADVPHLVKKISLVEIPKFIYGFKLFRKE